MDKLLKLKDRIVAKLFKILTLNIIFPLVYKLAARKPIDDKKILFIEIRLPAISNSFKVIFDELVSKYDFTVHTHFLRNGSGRRNLYLKRCIDMLKDMATAKYVFMNEASNCTSSVNLRPETKITQLWHGCGAFKKFGLSTADLIFGDNRKEQLKHPYNRNYSLVTVSSPEVAWAYEEAMDLSDRKEIIKATGSSRTDVFYDKEFIKTAYDTFYDVVPQAKGKKVILYAPTFRGRVASAKTSFMLNLKMFYEELGNDYFVLFKHHPHAKKLPEVPSEYSDFAMDVTHLMEIEDLLCVSDICITDYSSLVFEYSLFEKPIIFFAYDLDTYFDWRGFYYDYYEMSPGPVCTTNMEMINYIKNLDTEFDIQKVKDFRYKFMRSCDGNSTKRILEEIIGEDVLNANKKENEKVFPFNVVPKSNLMYRDIVKNLKTMEKEKEIYSNEYNKLREKAVTVGKIVMLDCSKELKRSVSVYCPDVESFKTKKKSRKEMVGIVRSLATAEFIFIEKDNKLLDMLNIKDETTVVYIPEYAFAFNKFEKATLDYKSGYYKNREQIAPTDKRVDKVAAAGSIYKDIYTESIGVNEASLTYVGDVKSDCFFDESYRKKAVDRLSKKANVDLRGKKLLLDLVHRSDENPPQYECDCDNYLYEYLKDDYIILKYFVTDNNSKIDESNYTPSMESYTKGIINITGMVSVYEAVAISNVVIGSVTNSFFLAFSAMKPSFAFVPELRSRLHNREINFKYEAVLPVPAFTDPKALAIAVKNSKDFDFSKLSKFSDTFFNNPDGKSTERLLVKLGVIK